MVWKCVSVSVYMAWGISLFMLNLHFCEYIHLQVFFFQFPFNPSCHIVTFDKSCTLKTKLST